MPVMATQNIEDKGIFNTMEFIIQDIKDHEFKIKDVSFDETCAASVSA